MAGEEGRALRTRVYVDGYNFYYGCLKGKPSLNDVYPSGAGMPMIGVHLLRGGHLWKRRSLS